MGRYVMVVATASIGLWVGTAVGTHAADGEGASASSGATDRATVTNLRLVRSELDDIYRALAGRFGNGGMVGTLNKIEHDTCLIEAGDDALKRYDCTFGD